MKKAAILLYPDFSLQEISCLTELFKFYDKEIVTFSAGKETVRSEDGFTILPDRALEDYDEEEFDCVVLPGIWEPLPVLMDERIISFLRSLRKDEKFLIAAISAAPLLLGKAGLLDGKRFTSGVFEEFLNEFPVMPRSGILRRPIVEDGNLITAIGDAYREFAIAVAHHLGINCPSDIFSGTEGKEYTEQQLTFHLPPELLEEAKAYWQKFC